MSFQEFKERWSQPIKCMYIQLPNASNFNNLGHNLGTAIQLFIHWTNNCVAGTFNPKSYFIRRPIRGFSSALFYTDLIKPYRVLRSQFSFRKLETNPTCDETFAAVSIRFETKKNLTDTFATTFITICKKVATAESAIGGLRSCRKGLADGCASPCQI